MREGFEQDFRFDFNFIKGGEKISYILSSDVKFPLHCFLIHTVS